MTIGRFEDEAEDTFVDLKTKIARFLLHEAKAYPEDSKTFAPSALLALAVHTIALIEVSRERDENLEQSTVEYVKKVITVFGDSIRDDVYGGLPGGGGKTLPKFYH